MTIEVLFAKTPKQIYRESREIAESVSSDMIQSFVEGFRSTWHGKLLYALSPGPVINAYQDVLEDRK